MQLIRAGLRPAAFLVVVAVLLILSPLLDPPTAAIVATALILGSLAISFQVVYGFLGELSLGHAALFGAGAYAYAVLADQMSPYLAVVGATLTGGVIAAVVALLTVRLGGVYFAVVTFALASIAAVIVSATESLGRTEGLIGVESLPQPEAFLRPQWQVVVTGAVFALFLALIILARRTRFGMTLEMARSDRGLALSQGVNVAMLRVVVTVLSGFLAGTAGALLAQSARFVSPDVFGLYYIITPLSIVAVGGIRHSFGVIPGLIIVVLVPRFLGLSPILNAVLAALLLVAAILAFPRGVAGALTSLVRRIWPERPRPGAPDEPAEPNPVSKHEEVTL